MIINFTQLHKDENKYLFYQLRREDELYSSSDSNSSNIRFGNNNICNIIQDEEIKRVVIMKKYDL